MSVEAPEGVARGFTVGGMPPAATAFYANTVSLSATVVAEVRRLWSTVDYGNLEESWSAIAARLLEVVSAGQLAAAGGAEAYLAACLGQLGIDATAFGVIAPSALAGSAADGRSLLGVLYSPVVTVKTATLAGIATAPAMSAGLAALVTIVDTTLADTARQAVAVGMAARPAVTGYVRAVNGGACARCVILAGRFYRYSSGFDRHPRCHCTNVPSNEEVGRDLITDPDEYVKNLPAAEKERILGKGAARAFDEGANLNQLVNARRRGGVSKTTIGGRTVETTIEGTTSRGMYGRAQDDLARVATTDKRGRRVGYTTTNRPRLTPDAIFEVAEDRAEAIALLKRNGYLLEE